MSKEKCPTCGQDIPKKCEKCNTPIPDAGDGTTMCNPCNFAAFEEAWAWYNDETSVEGAA